MEPDAEQLYMAENTLENTMNSAKSEIKHKYMKRFKKIFKRINIDKILKKEAANGAPGVGFYFTHEFFDLHEGKLIDVKEEVLHELIDQYDVKYNLYTKTNTMCVIMFIWKTIGSENEVLLLPKYRVKNWFGRKDWPRLKKRKYVIEMVGKHFLKNIEST